MTKLIAWMFAGLLVTAGWSGARADDKKTDDNASQAGQCKPLPRLRRLVNIDFKPNSQLTDVAGAYAAMSCKRLKITGDLSAHRVTVDKRKRMSLEELGALVRSLTEKAGVDYLEDDSSIVMKPAPH